MKIDRDVLGILDRAGFELLKLHTYDAVKLPKNRDGNPLIGKDGKPVPPRKMGKAPIEDNWTKTPANNVAVMTYLASRPKANAGIRLTDTLMALDVDPRNGGDASLAKLAAETGVNFSEHYPRTVTGSDGLHLWFRKPADMMVMPTLRGYDGLEFKTRGTQVVAPGSIHPDTLRPYRLEVDEFGDLGAGVNGLPDLASDVFSAFRNLVVRESCSGRPEEPVRVRGAVLEGSGLYSDEQLEKFLSELNAEDFQDEKAWRDLMMACHDATGGSGCEVFVDWSTSDPAYAEHGHEIANRWASLNLNRAGNITFRSLHYTLKAQGKDQVWERGAYEDPDAKAADEFANAADPDIGGDGLDTTAGQTVAKAKPDHHPINQVTFQTAKGGEVKNNLVNAMRAIKASGLTPAFDELGQRYIFLNEKLPWDITLGQELTDQTLTAAIGFLVRTYAESPADAAGRIEHWNYQPSEEFALRAIKTMALRNIVNPVADYLKRLQWDGKPRVERLFPAYFRTADEPYTRGVSRCFMIGAAKRALQPGCKFDTVPVLNGFTGKEKSTGIKVLFGAQWVVDSKLDLQRHDIAMLISGAWCVELPEMGKSMRANSIDDMKAFLSLSEDKFRAPYARAPEVRRRRNVFVGSVNIGGYLRDFTGNRRFWPLDVSVDGPVRVDELRADRDQLWAEAVYLLKTTERGEVLPEELWPEAELRQKAEMVEEPWEDILRGVLEEREAEYDDWTNKRGEYAPNVATANHPDSPEPDWPFRISTQEIYSIFGVERKNQTSKMGQLIKAIMEGSFHWKPRAIRFKDPDTGHSKTMSGYFHPTKDKNLS